MLEINAIDKHTLILCNNNVEKSSIFIFGDKSSQYIDIDDDMLVKLIQQGLALGIKIVIIAKSIEQLKSQYGEKVTQTMLNNCISFYR